MLFASMFCAETLRIQFSVLITQAMFLSVSNLVSIKHVCSLVPYLQVSRDVLGMCIYYGNKLQIAELNSE
jgi:hypothetical protein